ATSSAAVVIEGGPSFTHGSADYAPEMGMACDTCGAPSISPEGTERDPIDFRVTDLATGIITTGTLFDVSSAIRGDGTWSWSGGTFALNATDFDFHISINSPFTVQQGTANLVVQNGIVTTSDGSGIFSGVFPAIGSAGTFSTPLSNAFS